MTICMAAICADAAGKEGAAVVVASDRMVTMANLIEFEHTVPKAYAIGGRALALIAGDSLSGTQMVKEVATAVDGAPLTIAQLAQDLSANYTQTRNRNAEADILVPRGLTWASFYGQHQHLVAQVTMMLDQQLNGYNLGVELLIAGVDDNGGHIFAITNPGSRALDHDVIGYSAVGSGALPALQSMIGFRHSVATSLQETAFRVYASKRRAEVAPGVGHETDMFVIQSTSTTAVPAAALDDLGRLYTEFLRSSQHDLRARLRTVPLIEPVADGHRKHAKQAASAR